MTTLLLIVGVLLLLAGVCGYFAREPIGLALVFVANVDFMALSTLKGDTLFACLFAMVAVAALWSAHMEYAKRPGK